MVKWQNVFFMGKLWCLSTIFSITKGSGELSGLKNVFFGLGNDKVQIQLIQVPNRGEVVFSVTVLYLYLTSLLFDVNFENL